MDKHISSLQNPFIKDLILYKEKPRARRRAQLFLIEGEREIGLAIEGGYEFTNLIYQPNLAAVEFVSKMRPLAECISVSAEVYERLAYRSGTEGLIAVARFKSFDLNTLEFSSGTPLVLIAEAPEKPGNLGALLRTADAAALDAVIITNPKSDLFNPNIIRSSVGCLFTNQIASGTTSEVISYLKEKGFAIFCATLQESESYVDQNFTGATAIVVGTEDSGLTAEWLQHSTRNIIIPMSGVIDSMNVSVAAAILIFEAKRQRGF